MADEKNSTKNFLIGFIAGGAIGALLALLYAPKSGKEFREDLKKKSTKILNEADEYFEIAKNKTVDLMNDAKKKSEDLITKTKLKAESLLEESNELLNKAKDSKMSSSSDEDFQVSGIDAYNKKK